MNVLPSLSRLMKDGIGARYTHADHPALASQLYAAYARAAQVRVLASVVGVEGLADADRRYLAFGTAFEQNARQPDRGAHPRAEHGDRLEAARRAAEQRADASFRRADRGPHRRPAVSDVNPTRSVVVEMKDERRAMHEGYVFLDEKCLLLAGEILAELGRYARLRRALLSLHEAALDALRAAVLRHGLEGLQVYPPADLAPPRSAGAPAR